MIFTTLEEAKEYGENHFKLYIVAPHRYGFEVTEVVDADTMDEYLRKTNEDEDWKEN